jgi:phosphatidylserine decarboxylase
MQKVTLMIIILAHAILVNAQHDCPPVTKLKGMYAADGDFKKLLDSAMANVQPMPDGSPNFWKNKHVDDLYSFFNKWFFTLPTVSNGLDDIVVFSQLYYHNPFGLRLVNQEPGLSWTLYFVREEGKFMDSRESTASIDQWQKDSSLHNEEYLVPARGYQSFNEFFTRSLRPGMRPVTRPDDQATIVSPVDGMVISLNVDLKLDSAIQLKGRMKLNLNQLLGNSRFANRFVDGSALSLVLLPRNYHHFHAPVSGELVESKQEVGTALFGSQLIDFFNTGVPDISVFENYKHGYFIINTRRYGYVAVIPVGLETVGSVVFEKQLKDIGRGKELMVTKGQKLGHFAYGGSMVVLLFEKDRMPFVSVQQGAQIGVFSNETK